MEFFFHLLLNVRSSPVWLNCKSVIAVVRLFRDFKGVSSTPVAPSIAKRLTLPILLPVARRFPVGLTAIAVELKLPVSGTLPMHLRVATSH